MKLGFEESQSAYSSGSQSARAWTEAWVSAWAYCPHCGNARISSFPNNSPLADFFCTSCNEEFELKSQKGKFGTRVVDGAFKTKCERLAASNNPNLLLMNYDLRSLIFSSCQNIFLSARLSRNESRWPSLRDAPAGSDRTSCSAAFRNPARFTSFRAAWFGRRSSFLQNGKGRYFSEMNRRRRVVGCSTS
jgi:predicted RNA-binding Zn-ribbon protein involved in translation (DUF1610 family)